MSSLGTNINLHISQIFGLKVPESELDFFDANARFDSRLFIDPFLIKRSPLEEERKLYKRFSDYFKTALNKSLNMRGNSREQDSLLKFFSFKEPKEICLGYTEESNSGSGLGSDFAKSLYEYFLKGTSTRLVFNEKIYPENEIDPEVFTIFAEKVAQDGISDLSANLIMDYLIKYTQEQCKKYSIDTKILPVTQTFDFEEMDWTNGSYFELPENPFKPEEPIVFVPKRFLRANYNIQNSAKSKIVGILRTDPNLIQKFSKIVTKPLRDITIQEIRNALIGDEEILEKYVAKINRETRKPYDFIQDPQDFYAFKKYHKYFLNLVLPKKPDECTDILELARTLIKYFREEFERKDGWREAWEFENTVPKNPRKEDSWGRTFRAMGCIFFSNYPEITFQYQVESGNGPLDFGIIYKDCRIAIEIKKLANASHKGEPPMRSYLHGIVRQLPFYSINIKAKYAFYITGQHYKSHLPRGINHDNRVKEIEACIEQAKNDIYTGFSEFKDLFYENIDLTPKRSASNL